MAYYELIKKEEIGHYQKLLNNNTALQSEVIFVC